MEKRPKEQNKDVPKDDFSSALTRARASNADGTQRHQQSLHGLQLIPRLSYSFVSLRADFGLNIYAAAEGGSGRDRHKTPTRLSIIIFKKKKTTHRLWSLISLEFRLTRKEGKNEKSSLS